MRAVHRALCSGLCLSFCLLTFSCRRNTVATAPAAPPPAPIVVPRKDVPKTDVNLPAPPPIASKTTPAAAPPAGNPPVLQPPAAPKPRRPRLARRNPAPKVVEEPKTVVAGAETRLEASPAPKETAPPPPEASVPAVATAAPAPKLGQMLTPEESRDHLKRLDTTVDRVKAAMTSIQAKGLSEDQKEVVGRIRSFLAQAEQAREQDLVSAVNLAERADLLSRDLLDRLR